MFFVSLWLVSFLYVITNSTLKWCYDTEKNVSSVMRYIFMLHHNLYIETLKINLNECNGQRME